MGKFRFTAPSPALVVATAALFVAMGGTGYAAFHLGKSSVGAKQLKNGAVTSSKIVGGAVTSSKIANGAVTKSKVNLSGVTVPSAVHAGSADSATAAGNANTVGGEKIQKFFFKGTANTAPSVILHVDGLSISAGCDASSNPIIVANSDTTDTQLKISGDASGTVFANSWSTSGGPTRNLDLTGGHGLGNGTGTYSILDGHVVTFDYAFDDPNTYGTFTGCTVVGQAIAS
jgi:hypothetical protein